MVQFYFINIIKFIKVYWDNKVLTIERRLHSKKQCSFNLFKKLKMDKINHTPLFLQNYTSISMERGRTQGYGIPPVRIDTGNGNMFLQNNHNIIMSQKNLKIKMSQKTNCVFGRDTR